MKNRRGVRVIVLFGDISGFSGFWDSVTDDEKELDPFLDSFDDLVEETRRETGYSFADTGDGFMVIVDFPEEKNGETVAKVLDAFLKLLKKLQQLIETKEPPRPAGFRITGAMGYVKQKVKQDGRILYRGKPINFAHNTLDLARGVGLLIQGTLREMVSERVAEKYGLTFTHFKKPRVLPHGVSAHDAEKLFAVGLRDRRTSGRV